MELCSSKCAHGLVATCTVSVNSPQWDKRCSESVPAIWPCCETFIAVCKSTGPQWVKEEKLVFHHRWFEYCCCTLENKSTLFSVAFKAPRDLPSSAGLAPSISSFQYTYKQPSFQTLPKSLPYSNPSSPSMQMPFPSFFTKCLFIFETQPGCLDLLGVILIVLPPGTLFPRGSIWLVIFLNLNFSSVK